MSHRAWSAVRESLTIWKLCPHFPDTTAYGQHDTRESGALYALTQWAVVAGVFACGTCPIKVDLTDATNIVFGNVPSPGRDRVPLFDLDLHLETRGEERVCDLSGLNTSSLACPHRSGRLSAMFVTLRS